MALTSNKFILPDGVPNASVQITQSSSIGPDNLWDFGVYYYIDNTTQSSSFLAFDKDLTNNDNGSGSFVSSPDLGPFNLWNTATNQFDFSSLAVGDMIDIGLEMNLEPASSTQDFDIFLNMGIGGTQRKVRFFQMDTKHTDDRFYSSYKGIFLRDSSDINNPAKFRLESSSGWDVTNLSFYLKLTRKGRTP